MAITNSYLTVTPTWVNKRLTIDGSASVRESVALKIVGCSADTSVVFKLSSEDGRVDYAKFPNAAGDAWTVAEGSADLTGTLNLNTDLLVAAFASLGPDDRIDLVCTVASATNSNLFALGHKQIGNWMENVDDPVAYSTPLADDIASLTEDFEAHTHDGTDAPKVDHAALTGAGANTHDQIDFALTGIAASLVTLSSGNATRDSNINANIAAIAILNGEAVKHADFAPLLVPDITLSTATVKKLATKINDILAILRG